MSERIHAPHVGSPDPEMRNSPIMEETAEDFDEQVLDSGEFAACYFNDTAFEHRSYVCSGDELLRCNHGKWLRSGSCDLTNP